jgi:hypothetical protein
MRELYFVVAGKKHLANAFERSFAGHRKGAGTVEEAGASVLCQFAMQQHLHQRPVRRARPRHQRNRQRSKLGLDVMKKLPGEGGGVAGKCALTF